MKRALKKLKELAITTIAAATFATSCNPYHCPDNANKASSSALDNKSTIEIINNTYYFHEDILHHKEIDKQSYLEHLAAITYRILEQEDLAKGISNITLHHYDDKKEHEEWTDAPACFLPACSQILILPYLEYYEHETNLQTVMHEAGHLIEHKNIGDRGEKISEFMEIFLPLAAYTQFPDMPEDLDHRNRNIFNKDETAKMFYDLAKNDDQFLEKDDKDTIYNIGMFAVFRSLYEANGDFNEAFKIIKGLSDGYLKRKHSEALDSCTLCEQMEEVAGHIEDYILSGLKQNRKEDRIPDAEDFNSRIEGAVDNCAYYAKKKGC